MYTCIVSLRFWYLFTSLQVQEMTQIESLPQASMFEAQYFFFLRKSSKFEKPMIPHVVKASRLRERPENVLDYSFPSFSSKISNHGQAKVVRMRRRHPQVLTWHQMDQSVMSLRLKRGISGIPIRLVP